MSIFLLYSLVFFLILIEKRGLDRIDFKDLKNVCLLCLSLLILLREYYYMEIQIIVLNYLNHYWSGHSHFKENCVLPLIRDYNLPSYIQVLNCYFLYRIEDWNIINFDYERFHSLNLKFWNSNFLLFVHFIHFLAIYFFSFFGCDE
jgi:hypothetical protein